MGLNRLVLVLLGLGFLNLIILDFILYKNLSFKEQEPILRIEETSKESPKVTDLNTLTCPASCISRIEEVTSSIKIVQPTSTPRPVTQITPSSSKESYVALGSGSTSAGDWTDVSGAFEYIDSTKYGRIKTVTFEASVRIPTGNQTAYVRLFNVTDKHPVWFSEISLEGGTPRDLVSQPITLDPGVKLYQVQMKTSLKYTAILDKASVHIVSF